MQTTVRRIHIVSCTQYRTQIVSNQGSETCRTHQLSYLYKASLVNCHIEVRFKRRGGDTSHFTQVVHKKIPIFDHLTVWKPIRTCIVPHVSFFLISIMKL